MKEWYIVKINWEYTPCEYLGLDGDYWPDIQHLKKVLLDNEIKSKSEILLKEVKENLQYIKLGKMGCFNESWIYVITNLFISEKYFSFLDELNLSPILISVTDDLTIDCDGYDFGNPEGGFSIITDMPLAIDKEKTKLKYLNENFLFKNVNCLNEFLKLYKSFGEVEYLDGGMYYALAIKKIK